MFVSSCSLSTVPYPLKLWPMQSPVVGFPVCGALSTFGGEVVLMNWDNGWTSLMSLAGSLFEGLDWDMANS